MSQPNYITRGGEIKIKETKRGLEFHCYNFQKNRSIHIGTLYDQVYEKCTAILFSPGPSVCFSQSELGVAIDSGAQYLRVIPSGKNVTLSISIQDFKANAVEYHNRAYGPQWRCPLTAFERSGAVVKRSPILDNPTKARADLNIPRQLSMFRRKIA